MSEKSKKNWSVFLKVLSYIATALLSVVTGEIVL